MSIPTRGTVPWLLFPPVYKFVSVWFKWLLVNERSKNNERAFQGKCDTLTFFIATGTNVPGNNLRPRSC